MGEDRSLVICHGESFAQRGVLSNKSAIAAILKGNGDLQQVQELLTSVEENNMCWVKACRTIDRLHAFRLSRAISEDGKKRWARTEQSTWKGVFTYFNGKLCKVSRSSHNADIRELKNLYFAIYPEALRASDSAESLSHATGIVEDPDGKVDCAYPSGSEAECDEPDVLVTETKKTSAANALPKCHGRCTN